MRWHKVEVDDDVFEIVQKHAEPLVDTFNSALRKVLVSGRSTSKFRRETGDVANFEPDGLKSAVQQRNQPTRTTEIVEPDVLSEPMPAALRQILKVVWRVSDATIPRVQACHEVANDLRITFQSVLDKCTRQLGIKTNEFDAYLHQGQMRELENFLLKRFSEQRARIQQFFTVLKSKEN